MSFQKRRRNWNRVHPTSLKQAFRLCKEHAREKNNHSVSRIAELMDASEDQLYKWLSNGRMPSSLIPAYEHICGIHFVSDYLAASGNRLVITIPTGRSADAEDILALQTNLNEAIGKLLHFYKHEADYDTTEAVVLQALRGLAFHRENIKKAHQPELELER